MEGRVQCGDCRNVPESSHWSHLLQVKEAAAKETGEKRKRGRPKKTDAAPAKEAKAKAPKKPKAPKAKKQKVEKVALDNTKRDDSKLMNLRRICRWLEGGDSVGNLVYSPNKNLFHTLSRETVRLLALTSIFPTTHLPNRKRFAVHSVWTKLAANRR